VDVLVVGTQLLRNLQFPKGVVLAAGIVVQDAQIKVRQFNLRV
jgi:hypothetical protein